MTFALTWIWNCQNVYDVNNATILLTAHHHNTLSSNNQKLHHRFCRQGVSSARDPCFSKNVSLPRILLKPVLSNNRYRDNEAMGSTIVVGMIREMLEERRGVCQVSITKWAPPSTVSSFDVLNWFLIPLMIQIHRMKTPVGSKRWFHYRATDSTSLFHLLPIFNQKHKLCRTQTRSALRPHHTRGNRESAGNIKPRPKFPLFNFYLGSFTERLDSNFSMIIGYSNEFFCHSLSKGLKYSPVPLDLPERYIVPRPLLFWIPCIPISTVYP